MLLFILESIGTSELILIGIVALIFLGPRKLPQIAKTIGRAMADFRNTTNEFKTTWEREVDFEEEARALRTIASDEPDPTPIPRGATNDESENVIAAPEVKQIDADIFDRTPGEDKQEAVAATPSDDDLSDKRNWL